MSSTSTILSGVKNSSNSIQFSSVKDTNAFQIFTFCSGISFSALKTDSKLSAVQDRTTIFFSPGVVPILKYTLNPSSLWPAEL